MKVCIGLTNPKSPLNIGSVLRAASCYQVGSIFYTGERYDRAEKFNTDPNKAGKNVHLTGVDDLLENVPEGAKIVCIELVEGAIPLPEYEHPDNVVYIFGPEDGTISQKVINKADDVVYIPTIGCMNLAATVNVVLYDRLAKSKQHLTDDNLIRKSRDTNNKVKVKAYRNKRV